jgi:excisionase family DNA binding protein
MALAMSRAQDERITVEEASELTGASVATVRRWSATGKVDAEKVGRQWLIQRSSLPSRRRQVTRTSARVDLALSLTQLKALDLRDVWVPDVLRFQDYLAQPDDSLAAAGAALEAGGPFGPVVEVDVPKTPFFARAGGSVVTRGSACVPRSRGQLRRPRREST